MIAQRTSTRSAVSSKEAALEEAIRFLATKTGAQRWVCEVCGMIHSGSQPSQCESCGTAIAPVPYTDIPREMNSRW